ncbi:MAG: outer membrane beta-barrel protein [Ignavibacteria bacterium]
MKSKNLISIIITLAVIIFTFGNSNAQLLNISVKGGYNLSDISGDYPYETKNKSGFNFYVSKDIINLLVLTLSGEAGYTQKGYDEDMIITNKFGVETGREEFHNKLNYIDISILGKVKIPGIIVFPYLLAGPSLGFKVGSSVSSSGTEPINFPEREQFLEDFKSTSFGFKFGLGVEIGLPVISILAEGRYNPDITTSYEKDNIKVKNRVFEFLLGVKF